HLEKGTTQSATGLGANVFQRFLNQLFLGKRLSQFLFQFSLSFVERLNRHAHINPEIRKLHLQRVMEQLGEDAHAGIVGKGRVRKAWNIALDSHAQTKLTLLVQFIRLCWIVLLELSASFLVEVI